MIHGRLFFRDFTPHKTEKSPPVNLFYYSNSTEMPPKTTEKSKNSLPIKTPSPARKAKTKKESSTFMKNLASANQVSSKRVFGIEGLAVVMFLRSNGVDPSFNGTIIQHIESDTERLESCHVTLFTNLRNSNGTNEPAKRVNTAGNSYAIDVAVVVTDGEVTVNQACTHLAKTMTDIAKSDCKNEFSYGLPVYVNKGDTSPPTLLHLSHYLMDYDCITIMKRIYEKTETKEELLNNPEKDDILKIIFGGDGSKGLQILEGMEEDVYIEL